VYKKYERIFRHTCEDLYELFEIETQRGVIDSVDGPYFYEAVIKIDVEMARFSEILDDIKSSLYSSSDIASFLRILNDWFSNDKIKFKHINTDIDVYTKMGDFNLATGFITIRVFNKISKLQNENKDDDYEDFINQVLSILGHELIHRVQSLRIKYNKIREKVFKGFTPRKEVLADWKKYFSNKQELMSYAWQIVNNFRMHGITDNFVKKILTNINSQSNIKYELGGKILEDYHSIFTIEEEPLKLLYKYMYQYLD
jgi:hypothetical protein